MLAKIRNILKNNTAALISDISSRKYLSGFSATDGFLVITKSTAAFFADSRYIEAAKKEIKNMEVKLLEGFKSIKAYLEENEISEILIETENVSVEQAKLFRKQLCARVSNRSDLSKMLKTFRMVKGEKEIENIKKAQEITDKAFSHILKFIKVGVSEKDIALELEFFMRKMGSEGVAFDTIAVSGKNSSLPHGEPSEKKIENGDFLTLDFGAVVNGYRSDMTRTVAIGSISEEQKRAYNLVLSAQEEALKNIKAGLKCCDIDKIARDIIDGSEFSGAFSHSLGHSVGIDIHEAPNFSLRDTAILKENMVLTVEPGIYLEGKFGVRIEDLVVVTKEGVINLTKSTKELIVL